MRLNIQSFLYLTLDLINLNAFHFAAPQERQNEMYHQFTIMRFTLFSLLLTILPLSVIQSQIIETAPVYNTSLRAYAYKQSISNPLARQIVDTLNLPFMDDFSYEGPRPRTENWIGHSAFVNNTLSNNPPSVGVATLDGLDHTGAPYGSEGSSDTLTSCPFYLGSYTEADDVYLSFYYQAKGEGDRPELNDILILEFKDDGDNWNEAGRWQGISSDIPESFIPEFSFFSLAISDTLLYDGFQFRMRNLSSGKGQVDLWHVDYFRLTANLIPDINFNDIAFTEMPNTFLKSYESMPWKHFEGFESEETTDAYTLTFFNHFPIDQDIVNRAINIKEVTTDVDVLNSNFLTNGIGNVEDQIFDVVSNTLNTGDYNVLLNNLQTQFTGSNNLVFETHFGFTLEENADAYPPRSENNIIFKRTVFDNYFAYDDGTAESNVKAQNQGTDIAVKFHANVADSIKAFQIHIPHVSVDASLQLFNFKIYLDLESEPIYTANFQSPNYVDEFEETDTLQGFTTYVLKDLSGEPSPVAIPAGDFYIGWEQGSETDNPIPVGFDKNNPDVGVNNFYNGGTGWEPFPSTLQGAILIRPVVGDEVLVSTSAEDLAAETFFSIYPNPADEVLVFNTLNGEDFDGGIEIFDVAGKKIMSSEYQEFIPVVDLENGIYFVQLTEWETSIRYTMKIVVQH